MDGAWPNPSTDRQGLFADDCPELLPASIAAQHKAVLTFRRRGAFCRSAPGASRLGRTARRSRELDERPAATSGTGPLGIANGGGRGDALRTNCTNAWLVARRCENENTPGAAQARHSTPGL